MSLNYETRKELVGLPGPTNDVCPLTKPSTEKMNARAHTLPISSGLSPAVSAINRETTDMHDCTKEELRISIRLREMLHEKSTPSKRDSTEQLEEGREERACLHVSAANLSLALERSFLLQSCLLCLKS